MQQFLYGYKSLHFRGTAVNHELGSNVHTVQRKQKSISFYISSVASNQGVGTDEGWIYLAFSVVLFSRRRDSFSSIYITY
jgi:hypothetical protein